MVPIQGVVAVLTALLVGWALARLRRRRGVVQASETLREAARADADRMLRHAELEAREAAHEVRAQAESQQAELERALALEQQRTEQREQTLLASEQALGGRRADLAQAENNLRSREGDSRASRKETQTLEEQIALRTEQIAGERRQDIAHRLSESLTEEARAQAGALLRSIDATAQDQERTREAKRIMGIALQRYQGHYLTERLLSSFMPAPGTLAQVVGPSEQNLKAIEEVTGIKLTLSDSGDSIRLEGLDGVGREVARRCMRRLEKNGKVADPDALAFVKSIAQRLDQEIVDLGRRAFDELKIPRAHAEIVKLVGCLNYRTSYTQNQWKHAIEAAFLCGMMADELDLDVKLARRAALMHDIGKSLTHAIDGSHAVIGADYARRLGEAEVVANAIGAHHADEPCNSVYAFIVAASDAMSGARPGARREQTESYVKRLQDLERIGQSFRGVVRVSAVGGGREVRVYVREHEVSDEKTVEMSSVIARKISEEMTFPGQIKVTVIRQIEAVETAR